MKVAKLFPGLEFHAEILEATTYLADSDDERDARLGDRLIVLEPNWRNKDARVTEFFRVLDDLHLAVRHHQDAKATATRGHMPEARDRSLKRKDHDSRPPTGLPANFFADRYLRKFSKNFSVKVLRLQPLVDLDRLKYPPPILRLVKQNAGPLLFSYQDAVYPSWFEQAGFLRLEISGRSCGI